MYLLNQMKNINKIIKFAALWVLAIGLIGFALYISQKEAPKPDQLQVLQDQKETIIRNLREQRLKKDNYIKLLSGTDAEIKKLTEAETKIDNQIKQRSLTGIDYVKSFQ